MYRANVLMLTGRQDAVSSNDELESNLIIDWEPVWVIQKNTGMNISAERMTNDNLTKRVLDTLKTSNILICNQGGSRQEKRQ